MGCDIHSMYEVRREGEWHNAGEGYSTRNYGLFAVLAGVRSYAAEAPAITDPRGIAEDSCDEYKAWAADDLDGHSHSWVTLAELKARAGDVGPDLITAMQALLNQMPPEATDDDVRMVFFFDN